MIANLLEERARELFYGLKPECQAHADGCTGCANSIAEIIAWGARIQAEARLEEARIWQISGGITRLLWAEEHMVTLDQAAHYPHWTGTCKAGAAAGGGEHE